MSIRFGIGFSDAWPVPAAFQQAQEQARSQLHGRDVHLWLVFATPHHPVYELTSDPSDHRTPLVGLTSAKVFFGEASREGVLAVGCHCEQAMFSTAMIEYMNIQNPVVAGRDLAENCVSEHYRSPYLFGLSFFDGALHNIEAVLHGMLQHLGEAFHLLGGQASDAFLFENTPLLHDHKAFTNGGWLLLFNGLVGHAFTCRHGCRPLGKPRYVTRVSAGVVETIDHRPAVEIFEHYFEAQHIRLLTSATMCPLRLRYPLGFRNASGEFILRHVLHVTPQGGLVCQGSIPEGAQVHVMIASKESLMESTQEALRELNHRLQNNRPKIIFVFESIWRHHQWGRAAGWPWQQIKKTFGEEIPVVGALTYSEISPGWLNPDSELHNGSLLMVTLG